jgi:lipoprotein-releasing system ATP-binding protein
MSSVLELININKNFSQGEQQILALKSVNLAVKKGEIVSLIGPSGSGKTTLLQIAGLLDSPTSGSILVNKIDATKSDDKIKSDIRKNHIGFVFQFHHLLPEFSALENVAMPLMIQGKSYFDAIKEAEKVLKEVELENRIHHKPSELSGGQQQRVAIARAVITKPSLILADEPTGNLDSELSARIFVLLQKMVKSYDIGCLIVTHNMTLANKADRTITIKDGEIFS